MVEEKEVEGAGITDEDPKDLAPSVEVGPLPEEPVEKETAEETLLGEVPEVTEDAPEPSKETAAPPNEPDVPAVEEVVSEEEEMPEEDPPGVITALTPHKFTKLIGAWVGAGKPRRITAFGTQWGVYDDGAKFVDMGPRGAMGDYGSLSTSRMR